MLGPDVSKLIEVARGVWVLPDHARTPHVPNIGIVLGDRAALVVDTGLGHENGRAVLATVRELAGDRPLFLTTTHFHPEHAYGAQAFAGDATLIWSRAQRDELAEKGERYVELFSGFSDAIAAALEGVELVRPDIAFAREVELDLGGRIARLKHLGDAHTRGDQIVFLPVERVLFTGDLVEERFFVIMDDDDAHAGVWIDHLERLEALRPAVVVPGHGALGDAGLLAEGRDYLQAVCQRVGELDAAGEPPESIPATIEREMLARHPDWDNREWVGETAVRFHRELMAARRAGRR
jgi:glyoxylase-like metal-dependent hydrolase (beta-lactamase superfamily II)